MTGNNTAIQARSITHLSLRSTNREYSPWLTGKSHVLGRGVRISNRTSLCCMNTARDTAARGVRISAADRGVRISGKRDVRISGHEGVRISGHEGVRISGHEGVRISGHEGVRISGRQGVRISGQQRATVGV